MNYKYILNRIKTTPVKVLLRALYRKVSILCKNRFMFIRDSLFTTRKKYLEADSGLQTAFDSVKLLNVSGIDYDVAHYILDMYEQHRFDLLGSGWKVVGHVDRKKPEDIVKRRDVSFWKQVERYISPDYSFIDWQKDYKSGYTWSAKKWYRPQENAKRLGGDIKMPWELSRLQHLNRLCAFSFALGDGKCQAALEYENELLDFIVQNPIRMGVNHMCTMDVGIRTANIAMSYSIYSLLGNKMSLLTQKELCNYLFESCDFIRHNLEWSESYTSNHYFADICGLLWGAASLPNCRRKKEWLLFARDEIEKEIKKQFNDEGTNREASVYYHRLTTEMALYSGSLIYYLSKRGVIPNLSEEVYGIIKRACLFIKNVSRVDGSMPMIGDNDSGQFFRFSLTGDFITTEDAIRRYESLDKYIGSPHEMFYDENLSDGRTLLSAAWGLFGDEEFKEAKDLYPFEGNLIRDMIEEPISLHDEYAFGAKAGVGPKEIEELKYRESRKFEFAKSIENKDLRFIPYPQFGVYVYKGEDFYLCICMTDNGENGMAGHTHNDKLSFELAVSGEILQADPGTYVYTSYPELRNKFRSTSSHNTAYMGEEQNTFLSLFSMKDETKCEVLKCDLDSFVGRVSYRDCIHIRKFVIKSEELIIEDYCNKPFTVNYENTLTTAGYGKLRRKYN